FCRLPMTERKSLCKSQNSFRHWQNDLTLLYFRFHFLICTFGGIAQRHYCSAQCSSQKQSCDKSKHNFTPLNS
ncbi:hypothetical protein, partial [Ruminococcus sp.]|uniref:hypothetical protein n=1 Tax=Ruminococcus sp. TaxID=41978 RepID=UPI00307B97A4